MILNDKIVAVYVEGFSGAYIKAPKKIRADVAKDFQALFDKAWSNAMDEAEKEYNAVCQEKEDEIAVPASVEILKDKIYVDIAPLYLSMNYGARADNEFGTKALEQSFKELKEKYPEITYQIYLAYEYSDEHSGGVINYEISSENKKVSRPYKFVEAKLKTAIEEMEDEFWEKLQYEMEDAEDDEFVKVLKEFRRYKVSDEVIESYLDLVDEIDDEIRETLEEIIESWDEE